MAYEFLGEIGKAFVPKRFRPTLRSYLLKAGMDDVPFHFFGALFFATIFLTVVTYVGFIHKELSGYSPAVVGVTAFAYVFLVAILLCIIIVLMIYFYLNIKIYNRTKKLEDKLIDYFTLVSTNLKGGLSFEKSLWVSIKPEFGILAKEIGLVSKKVLTGNDLAEALTEFSYKYDSPILRRSMNLIIGEVETGGHIVDVIDKVIVNLRKTRLLKDEMAASTVTYMIFIGAIVIVISPALFALSAQLLKIIIKFTAELGQSMSGSSSVLPVSMGEVSLDPQNFIVFSRLAIASIGVTSAFIISIIEKGDIKGGLKYVPLFTVTAIILYEIFRFVLGLVFSNIISI